MRSIVLKFHDPLERFVIISVGLHLLVLAVNNISGFFYLKPQFAVETAPASIDVMLVEEVQPVIKEEPVPVQEAIAEKIPAPQQRIQETPKDILKPVVSNPLKGALAQVDPDYLRNPAPIYPWEARRKGWEGVVILKVDVSRSGIPSSVTVEQSSGYAVLDESALKTVRGWRFSPGTIGGVPIETFVRVPVRFALEDTRHF